MPACKKNAQNRNTEIEITFEVWVPILQEDQLCQETQIKWLLLRIMEPVWSRLVKRIVLLLSTTTTYSSSSSSSSSSLCEEEEEGKRLYVLEGLRLWKSLISIRTNIHFVESRNFAGNLSACVYALQVSVSRMIWIRVSFNSDPAFKNDVLFSAIFQHRYGTWYHMCTIIFFLLI